MRNCSRRLDRWKENGIHTVDDVEQEGRIDWVSDGEGHGDQRGYVASVSKLCKLSEIKRSDSVPQIQTTSMTSTAEERYELITRRLPEVLGGDTIKNILAEGRSPKCYWGQSFDQ